MDFTKCPARDSFTDALELIEHDENGCDMCLGLEDLNEVEEKKPEVTVKVNPRPIIKAARSNNSTSATNLKTTADDVPPSQNTQNETGKMEKKPESNRPNVKTPRINKLSMGRIKKETGLSKGKAALKLLEIAKPEIVVDKPKTVVDKNQMPFSPAIIYLPLTAEGTIPQSILTFEKQRRYVAIISNFLKPEGGYRFEMNRYELSGFDELLVKEREFYEAACLERIDGANNNPYNYLSNQSRKLYSERVTERFKCLSVEDAYQKVQHSVYWPYNDESTSGRQMRPAVKTVLNTGFFPRILLPDCRRRCQLSDDSNLIRRKVFSNEATPIETDENAVNFALENELPFIMTASTLRSLLVMPWLYRDQHFSYKISVKQRLHNGRFCRYITFSKPLLSSPLSRPALQHQFSKWILKAAVFKEKSAKIGQKRHLSENEEPESASKKKKEKVEEMKDAEPVNLTESSSAPDLLDDIFKSMNKDKQVKPKEKPKEKVEAKKETEIVNSKSLNSTEITAASNVNDMLGDLLKGLDEANENESNTPEVNQSQDSSLVQFKKRYSIVDFETEYLIKSRILIRTTNHGVDQTDEDVCLTVKSDYLPAIGAERICEEELLWNYFTATFKSVKTLLNVRMHPLTGNLLQIQRFAATNFYSALSPGNRKLISQRSERLCNLLEVIKELALGDYLLKQSGEQMELFSETIENEADQVWNADELRAGGILEKLLPVNKPSEMWKGIDIHLPLVWHIVQGRVPGALMPFRENQPNGFKPREIKGMPNNGGGDNGSRNGGNSGDKRTFYNKKKPNKKKKPKNKNSAGSK